MKSPMEKHELVLDKLVDNLYSGGGGLTAYGMSETTKMSRNKCRNILRDLYIMGFVHEDVREHRKLKAGVVYKKIYSLKVEGFIYLAIRGIIYSADVDRIIQKGWNKS